MTPSTPKTHVLLASDAPVATILYRKSHRTSHVLQLDYGGPLNGFRNRLSKGSRFYGRFFPERCDVSPDGRLMVYFVMRGRRTGETSDPATWTAVCSPPWLKAHLFCPNNSTWGGGGRFLRDHRLIIFDTPHDPAASEVRGYRLVKDVNGLPAGEHDKIMLRFRPPAVEKMPNPAARPDKPMPVLLKRYKAGVASGFDMFDYELKGPDGSDVKGAEHLILANWAGWDIHGRLMTATGRHLKIHEVDGTAGLRNPVEILDLETAIGGTA